MGFLEKLFNKKNKGECAKGKVVIKKVAQEDIPEVAVLSYDNGNYKIPVDGLREGLKRFGYVKGYSSTKGFVDLKDLGDELLIFDPKYNHTIPLKECENPDYQDIMEMIYGKNTHNNKEEDEDELEY